MTHKKIGVTLSAVLVTASFSVASLERVQGDNKAVIEEILVTAQRRSESIQDVPMSVTAISSAIIKEAGISNTQDLSLVTPGLVTQISSSFFQPTIRGIGTRNNASGDEANVALFFDGVYLPEQSATLFELNSVERVEVLKGPQGTLFGRNATGGAINIITKKPGAETEIDVSLKVGEDGYRKGAIYVSGALNADKTLTAGLAAFKTEDDGYIENVFLGGAQGANDASGARLKFLFQPSDSVEFQLNGLYSESDNNSAFSGQSLVGNNLTRRLFPNAFEEEIAYPQAPRTTATQFRPTNKTHLTIIDAHMSVDLGFADLTGLLGYYNSTNHTISDVDVSPNTFFVNDQRQYGKSFYEELVLSSNSEGSLAWLSGLTFFQAESKRDQQLNGRASDRDMDTDAFAAFAEASYEVSEGLFITLGARYTEDEKKSSYKTSTVDNGGKKTFSKFSPKAILRYEFSENANFYVSYTEGFKTGTFNTSSASAVDKPVASETVKAFEAGVKGEVGSNMLYSVALYHYIYEDLQTQVVIDLGGGEFSVDLQNAPEAQVDGVEFSFTYAPTSQLNLNVGLSVLNAEITNFSNASITQPVIVNGLPAGNANVVADINGFDLIRAPKWSFNVGASYDVNFESGTLTFAGNALFSDKYYLESGNRLEQSAYQIVNGSVSYSPRDSHFEFSLFGKNLANEDYFQNATVSVVSDTVTYAKSRWFGATVRYSY